MPTSRATLLTWSAKTASVSIIPLMVSASAAISPLVSSTSLRLRFPLATSVTTLAIPRTCVVRLAAMELTLSVRSFQVPATPRTSACPPSLPSVPTSRATRVTSRGEAVELVHHGVDGVLQLQDFALHVHGDLAAQVAVGHRGGHLGDVADLRGQVAGHGVHAESVRSFQVPATPRTSAWPPSLPSVPTSRATRVTSAAKELS